MADISLALIDFFKKIASRETQILTILKQEENFQMNAEQWRFTLIDLHSFLQRYNSEYQGIDYNKFRKILYSSPINDEIKQFGAEITIDINKKNINNSVYMLIWR